MVLHSFLYLKTLFQKSKEYYYSSKNSVECLFWVVRFDCAQRKSSSEN